MEYKKSLMLICFIICLFSIASVCAGDVNETVVSSEDQTIVESQDVDLLEVENQSDVGVVEEDELAVSAGTFTDLANKIANADGKLNLTRDYIFTDDDSNYKEGIKINKQIIINGNGFIINGNNQSRAFDINSNNVILANISFINCSYHMFSANSNGGAVYWNGNNGNLFNCSFINCYSYSNSSSSAYSAYGGAVYWNGDNCNLFNCRFINSCVGSSYSYIYAYGGAIYLSGSNIRLSNCDFINCHSYSNSYYGSSGGAIYGLGDNASLFNCNFRNNSVGGSAGAVYWSGNNGKMLKCNFTNNFIYDLYSTSNDGGAIKWCNKNSIISNCNFVNNSGYYGGALYIFDEYYRPGICNVSNCTFLNNFAINGGAIYWISINGSVLNSNFINNSANYSGGAIYWTQNNGVLNDCNFFNNFLTTYGSSPSDGGAIYWYSDNGTISDCRFINNIINHYYSGYGSYGGAVYFYGANAHVFNCNFTNNFINISPYGTAYGGAIYLGSANICLSNCNFINNSINNQGGAVYWHGINGSMYNCNFINNSAVRGGASCWEGVDGEVYDCNFINNSAENGGCIFFKGDYGIIFNCTFNNNSYKGSSIYYSYAGAVYWTGHSGTILDCEFMNNYARYHGGAIQFNGKNCLLLNSNFVNNSAGYRGGAIALFSNNGVVSNCSFVNNFANKENKTSFHGGAIYGDNENVSFIDSFFINNNEYDIYWEDYDCQIINCSFSKLNKNCRIFNKSFISLYIPEILNFGETFLLKTIVTTNATGNISIYIDGDFIKVDKINTLIELNDLMPGNHTIKVIYQGDDNYASCVNSSTFEIKKINTSLSISNNLIAGNTIFNITLNNKTTGIITIIANNKKYVGEIKSGVASINILDLIAGNYDFTIEYIGDEIFNAHTENLKNVNIKYKDAIVSISANNCYIDEIVHVDYDITVGTSGEISIYDNGQFIKNISVGEDVKLEGLNAGIHYIKFIYNSDGYFCRCENTTKFEIYKLDPSLSAINYTKIVVGDEALIDYNIASATTGIISIYVNDTFLKNITVGNEIKIESLKEGIYTIKICYSGDNRYINCEITTKLEVNKLNPSFYLSHGKLIAGDNIDFNFIFDKDATGNIHISFGEWKYQDGENIWISNYNITSELINGKVNVQISNLKGGWSNYIVDYQGNEKYSSFWSTDKVYVEFKQTNLVLSPENSYVDEIAIINYDLSSNPTGTLSIFANDEFIKNVSVKDKIQLDNLTAGVHIIKVVYNGDDYFAPCESTAYLNVFKLNLDTIRLLYDEDCVAEDNLLLKFKFEDGDVSGHINVTFISWDENNLFTAELIDSEACILIQNITGGEHEFLFNYSGDSKYNPDLDGSYLIYVEYKEAPININIPQINWADTVEFTPNLPKGATGNIELLVDNIALADINVGNTYSYNSINGGKHYLTIKYSGDDYFTENETTVEFYVNKVDSTFDMENTFDSEQYITIPIVLSDDAYGDITVNINNKIYSGKVVNGTFNYTVINIGAGTHNVVINYTNDNKYNDIYIVKEITVNLKDSNINLDIQNILTGQNLLIKPTITDGAAGSIDIYVDGTFKKTINVRSSYTLQNPSLGQHKIRLVYSGNTYFASSESEYSFRVFTIYPIEATDTQIVYGTDKKFQAKFFDEYGGILANKYVLFIVNGEEYPVKTNDDGIAVLDVDLAVGEYNITSVSLLDENTTNKLLIFHSVHAESMIMEYGSDTRFKATFLDETAKPLSNTNIVFNVDGKDTMLKTDVNGVAILNSELTIGTHTITSINTITDESMTNKVVVVKDVNSIITVGVNNINYNQKAIINVNIVSGYLNANVTIKIIGENGYEQIFTQKASNTITKEITGLNASKYRVDVKYVDEDLLIIDKNATFTVSKIDPTISIDVDDTVMGESTVLEVNIAQATGEVEIKLNDDTYIEQLIEGNIVKEVSDFKIGENKVEIYYKGDNNYNPLIKSTTFKVWNNLVLDTECEAEVMFGEEYVIDIYNLGDDIKDNGISLFIDGKTQEYEIIFRYDDGDECHVQLNSNADLSEGEHTWKINYLDLDNYINASKTGSFNVIVPAEPDTYQFALPTNKSVINIPFDKINWNVKTVSVYDEYLAEYYDNPYVEYTFSTFTLDNVEYVIITSTENPSFASLAVTFNPKDYNEHDGIYYKAMDGEITEIIGYSDYNVYDNEYYHIVGSGYKTFKENAGNTEYAIVNGECYKITGTMGASTAMFNKAIQNVDYKIVNGKYYTTKGEIIENLLDESYGSDYAVINGTFYDINGNIYTPHSVWTIGDILINNNGQLSKVVYGKDYENSFAIVGGKLYSVVDDKIRNSVDIDMTSPVDNQTYENTTDVNKTVEPEIDIPPLDKPSDDGNVTVTLPSDATGTVTLTVDGRDYVFDVKDGVADVKLLELADGNYDYTITYSGDGKYSSFTSSGSMKVNKTSEGPAENTAVEPEVIIPSLDYPSEDGNVSISLPSDATGTVTLTVDGKDYIFDVKNGVANVKLPELSNGDYEYTIAYSGDSKYSSFTNTGSMKVNNTKPEDTKPTPEVVIPPLDEPSSDGTVAINLPSDATGTVTLSINGKNYYFAVVNGQANVMIPDLGEGNYPYTITYSGDSKYSSFTTNGSLTKTVPAVDPVITASNVKVTYATGKYYTIKVYGTDGKLANGAKVVITVNGKTFKTLTTANGIAKFKVTNVPGTYKMNIATLGKSVTKTLTVKHLVSLKSVTVKKSAKKLVLQATLGKVNGKYLKNKKITFKFNGKKYTAKTNAKGVAKVTIKSNVLKKLKVGKKVTYQATYGKDTVKKTVKIKK